MQNLPKISTIAFGHSVYGKPFWEVDHFSKYPHQVIPKSMNRSLLWRKLSSAFLLWLLAGRSSNGSIVVEQLNGSFESSEICCL